MFVDVKDLDLRLVVTDAPLGEMPEKITCPEHDDPSASMAVYPGAVHCYGCGLHSTGFFALALLLYGRRDEESMRRAVQVASRYTARSLDAYRERVDQQVKLDPLPHGLADAYHSLLQNVRSDRFDWLLERGIDFLSAKSFRLGHDGTRFTIPVFSATGDLLTIRYRRDDHYGTHTFDPRKGKTVAIPKYSGMRGRNGLFLYPAHKIASHASKHLVVVEGELDAVRLWQEGIPAVSATNGAGSVARLPALIREAFPQIDTLLFACDQDEAGREATNAGITAAIKEGFKWEEWRWPEEWGKDITEVLLTHSLEETGWMRPNCPA